MKRSSIIAVALAVALAGCATAKTEVVEYRTAPGQEVMRGNGGPVKVVNGTEVWLEGGTPPREFKILAEAATEFRHGMGDKSFQTNSALEQLVEEAKKRSADAVVIFNSQKGIAGMAYMPGHSTTTTTGTINSFGSTGYMNARSNTFSAPGYAAPIGSVTWRALFVKYL